jgi:PST family polysaccharide transporter
MSILQNIKGKLISNSLFMMVLQAAQMLVPLILMPFIINKFGIDGFGLLSFATAICMFINVICDYGFNLTATRCVAVNIDNPTMINQIFNTTISAKVILLTITGLIYISTVFIIDEFRNDWQIYCLSFGIVIGNVLFPLWLFQGFQSFRFITILNIVVKIAFTVIIFFVVNDKSDIYKVPLYISLGYIVPGLIAFIYAKRKYHIKLNFPEFYQLKNAYKESWHIFISRIAVFSYTSINIIFLEIFTSTAIVGYYAVASRIISAISSVVGMINQVLFPYLSRVWQYEKKMYFKKLKSFSIILVMLMFSIVLFIQLTSPYIVNILTGEKNELSVTLMRVLSLALILMPLGGLFTQSFVTQGKHSLVTLVTLKTTAVNFILIFLLTPLYGAYGMAASVCFVQLFQITVNLFYLSKLKGKTLCAA